MHRNCQDKIWTTIILVPHTLDHHKLLLKSVIQTKYFTHVADKIGNCKALQIKCISSIIKQEFFKHYKPSIFLLKFINYMCLFTWILDFYDLEEV